jgi:redox-sensitive bicupin YhaK (pirin superfamily)
MPLIAPLQRANHGSHFRALALRGVANLIDPFLGVDHAWMSAPTFPPHPHAGLSAVSYVFLDAETGLTNQDSLGNDNLIRPGGLHWMAAGSRVVHEEVPAEHGKTVHSLQIFVGLPPEVQGKEPFALTLEPQDIPVVQQDKSKVRVVLGCFNGLRSPMIPPNDVTMLDISLEHGAVLSLPVSAGECAFVVPIHGSVLVDEELFGINDLRAPVYPAQPNEQSIELKAPDGGAKVMLFSGRPLQS